MIDAATASLQPKPATFELVKRNFYDSQIDDFSRIETDIWKRPEFYPTWERTGVADYNDHDSSRWTVYGYGFFPGVQSWTANMQEGDTLVYYCFLHSSWGVETWQGMKLVSIHNETLFDVAITPNEFYLEPTYPVFYEDWTRMIKFTVTAKVDIPEGMYSLTVDILEPSESKTEEWSWEILDKFSEGKYTDEMKANDDLCEELLKMRQNKYVTGNMFKPDNGFVSYITVN